MNGIGTDIWGTADQFRLAYKQLTGNGSIVARVEGLVDSDPWAKAGVMIRQSLQAGSPWAGVFLTGTNGVRYQARLAENGSATSDSTVATAEQMAMVEPVWIKIERTGTDLKGYYSLDGKAWTAMAWNPQTLVMTDTVYIGLAVTSHNASVSTAARCSGISFTGSVSGTWQVAEIGIAQPAGNPADTFYIVVEDGTGKSKVVSHPDPALVATGNWEQWTIPLTEFTSAGVNLAAVKKMTLGVGSRTAPKAGGAGKLCIDDIRLTKVGQ
jgi:regulation of enolase protein 1 (concanavalin A-like superfamily)